MKKYWWKILSILLILYSIVFGFLIPLNPGIIGLSTQLLKAGEKEVVEVAAYNTHFSTSEGIKVWLKTSANYFLPADSIEIIDQRHLRFTVSLPPEYPSSLGSTSISLVVSAQEDGTMVLPDAFTIGTSPELESPMQNNGWQVLESLALYPRERTGIPFRNLLLETIRNLYFHVSMWFAMMIILMLALYFSIQYLRTQDTVYDHKASAFTLSGLVLGLLGLITGALWANYTWGEPWSGDVKQNMSAVALLIYAAYFVLRASYEAPDKKARVAASYNIFSFACLIPLLFVIPRLQSSLHPGSGGNPGFGGDDLDNTMRLVFYPAILGWVLFFTWISNIIWRYTRIYQQYLDLEK
jgi:heme exporter protein C